ncbi:unnamed protein product [Penicillium salamii]|uniref:Nephrocystin 3-like N-terminal domain-containing protein n=1 Tax=Penicillium salamii TaxID=1612424 RepID=A0A9W4JW05_9EURO|nr:unnamed protein product [Penicillium salamii]CAG8064149.1 unnamed protein product [Penicillium salamii]CAG8138040.1 unnamed protein product [Penicillium salamii]CAG8155518.1 unnamed protein product [Penicillium salamii]CAG8170684.1 unnamed protein product [Penicillium salamii]
MCASFAKLTFQQKQHNDTLLQSITYVASATYRSYDQNKGTCLEETQVKVFQRIQEWSIGSEKKPILWLQGMAGTGKSTIARTAAAAFRDGASLVRNGVLPDNVCLAGTFFFDHKKNDCRDPRNVFPTLARQLVEVIPEIRDAVCNAISNNHDIQQRTIREQWKYLIWQPLSMLQSNLQDTFIIVIDALDECEVNTNHYENDLEVILELLSQMAQLQYVRIRVLITSRPEAEMQRHIENLSQDIHDHTLEKVKLFSNTGDREDDITQLVKHEMIAIKKRHPSLSQDWPGAEYLRTLVKQTEGLFIYAATVCRFLYDANERTIQSRLEKILSNDFDGNSQGNNLDEMYTRILEIILTGEKDNDEENSTLFRSIVGCIVVLSQPMSLEDLELLLPCTIRDLKDILGLLGSVIEVPQDVHGPVQLGHLSFRDFLLDRSRCQNKLFSIDEKEANHGVFEHCIKLMSTHLRRDICRLREPGIMVSEIDLESSEMKQRFPDSVRYACKFWPDHLDRSGGVSSHDESRVLNFLETHFTHWLEAMCLLGMMPLVIKIFNVLKSMNMSKKMEAFLFDARKFSTNFRLHIEKMPLQIYASALPCAPENSIVRNLFRKEIPPWITQIPVVQSDWDAFSHNLEEGRVGRPEFSSDGTLLVCEWEHQFKIFETITWQCILQIDHDESIFCELVACSPDSTHIAALFTNGASSLWRVSDGKCINLETGGADTIGIRFSGDGKLVYLLSDNTMLIRNGKTGDVLLKMWHGVKPVRRGIVLQCMGFNFAVSEDCQFVAILDLQLNINVFSQAHGLIVQTYPFSNPGGSLNMGIKSLLFSPDGHLLLSATTDGAVKVWDLNLKKLYETTVEDEVLEATFIADSTAVLIVFKDLSVSKWWWRAEKTETRNLDDPDLKETFAPERPISFPQVGPLVASLASNEHDDLWKKVRATCAQIRHKSHGSNITGSFSPNGQFIAVGSARSGLSIWEVSTRVAQSPSAIENNSHIHVELSPDGNWVASSRLKDVRLWNGNTGEHIETWTISPNSSDWWHNMSFSTDSRALQLGSYYGEIQVWDMVACQPLARMQLSNAHNLRVAFPPDRTLLVFAYKPEDHTNELQITLWDLGNMKAFRTFDLKLGEYESLSSVAISPSNGTTAVSSNKTIRVFDSTGTLTQCIEHDAFEPVLAFSANGEFIAYAHKNITV